MKVNYEIIKQRREDIMRLIQKMGSIDIEMLINEFHVSDITIRRDLQYWEDKGAVIRYRGGAKLSQHMVDHSIEIASNDKYKHAIAKYAAQYIENGDTIFINSSSTALLIMKYIVNKRVTIITNNAKAVQLEHDPLVSIYLTGGELRFPKEAMVGDFALNNLTKITATKTFIGCSGINLKFGITTAILQEVAINECMVNRTSGHVFVLADYTKVGAQYPFKSSDISRIDYLITDINADEQACNDLKENNVEVIKLQPLMNIS
ncbi:Glucitol operon repressor [bioreactor metagenome]|uniref:Glucitol operon repressor n=1 Tax=bioreactor metagenome TaxID=1076179 RepID=A0A645BTJ5_9ZZZZ